MGLFEKEKELVVGYAVTVIRSGAELIETVVMVELRQLFIPMLHLDEDNLPTSWLYCIMVSRVVSRLIPKININLYPTLLESDRG